MIYEKEGSLYYAFDNETVRIDAWGKDAVRVRATRNHGFTAHDWALDAADRGQGQITLHEDAGAGGQVYANMYSGKNLSNGVLENGRIRVKSMRTACYLFIIRMTGCFCRRIGGVCAMSPAWRLIFRDGSTKWRRETASPPR